jgi:putative glycosyltransferase (TIGR04348 family)
LAEATLTISSSSSQFCIKQKVMRFLIVTPVPRGSRAGNRITAERWAGILRELNHRVTVTDKYDGQSCDVLIALHARRSAVAIRDSRERHPSRPILLALTGTDLHWDIKRNAAARRSLTLADKLILLEPESLQLLSQCLRDKANVILQSAQPVAKSKKWRPLTTCFEVIVVGHLRHVKDPFRAALAARRLPSESRIRIVHIGAALNESMRQRAVAETASNPRFHWQGELPHWQTRQRIARSRLLVMSSRREGAPIVISEALVSQVPILATQICATNGMLGGEYPGFFPVGDTERLRQLLIRAETDASFYATLKKHCARQAPRFQRQREVDAWRRMIKQFQV